MLSITDQAATKIKSILENEGRDPAEWALRIGVEGGGCSGFQYKMDWCQPAEGDNICEHSGARVAIDPKSLLLVSGSVLNYNDTLTGAGFVIQNPNATSTCGCGESFSV